jgi:hypothetical protein
MRFSRYLLLIALGVLILIVAFSLSPTHQIVKANEDPYQADTTPNPNLSIADETCIECHGQPGLTMEFDNGDILDLHINPDEHFSSIHGELGYACVQCHTTVGNYPHPPFTAKDLRDVSLQLYHLCQRCHIAEYTLSQDSSHAAALADGMREAAICTDCHTAHAVRQLTDPETGELLPDANEWIPQTCAQCHFAIFEKYQDSVHGSALIGEGNPDVPTCIDCHGVHNIEDPTTSEFRLSSPSICADCHSDPEIMTKYSISTDVLETYVADFHGTTVTLFEKQSPDAETNKPVCFDCHGVHDIQPTNDPESGLKMRENLLVRCKICHPDATINFPDSWLGHYIPDPENAPIVYYINLFYLIFIPVLLGGMGVLVVLDIGSTIRVRYRNAKKEDGDQLDSEQLEEAEAISTAASSAIADHREDDESGINDEEKSNG